MFWGDDFEGYTEVQLKRQVKLMSATEKGYLTEVIGDLSRSIIDGEYKREARPPIRRLHIKTYGKKKS